MSTSLIGLAGYGALLEVVLLLGSFGSIATYIIIVVANRADPDPSGKRPMAVYFFAGSFLTLWIAFIGAITVVVSLVGLIGRQTVYSFSELHPVGDAAIRSISIGLLLFVIGGWAHVAHRNRGLALADSESDPSSPTKRVARSYVAAISFISVIIVILALFALIYSLLGLIAPGVYEAGSRLTSFKMILDILFILLMTGGIFNVVQHMAPISMRLFPRRASAPAVEVIVEVTEP
jgi:sterol desaturase/sphingolipid hydroxylase (fatty acid hydroxylase superfamily)